MEQSGAVVVHRHRARCLIGGVVDTLSASEIFVVEVIRSDAGCGLKELLAGVVFGRVCSFVGSVVNGG
jgi:hypothetical protein